MDVEAAGSFKCFRVFAPLQGYSPVARVANVQTRFGDRLEGDRVRAPKPIDHPEDVAVDLQNALVVSVSVDGPEISGQRLRLDLNHPVEVGLPLRLSHGLDEGLAARISVAHQEAGVVSVRVRRDLGDLKAAVSMPDEETRLINRLERRESVEEVIFPGEPRTVPFKRLTFDVAALDVDLPVALDDVMPRTRHGLERHRTLTP